jgi:hypothetical protein
VSHPNLATTRLEGFDLEKVKQAGDFQLNLEFPLEATHAGRFGNVQKDTLFVENRVLPQKIDPPAFCSTGGPMVDCSQ